MRVIAHKALDPWLSMEDGLNTPQPWNTPQIVPLPNGNTFICCSYFGKYISETVVICRLLNSQLDEIDRWEVKHYGSWDKSCKQIAYCVEDHTVWLILPDYDDSNRYVWVDTSVTYSLDCRGDKIEVISGPFPTIPDPVLARGLGYTLSQVSWRSSIASMLYMKEINVVVLRGMPELIVIRNGIVTDIRNIIHEGASAYYDGEEWAGDMAVNPQDPTKFASWTGGFYGNPSAQVVYRDLRRYFSRMYETTIDRNTAKIVSVETAQELSYANAADTSGMGSYTSDPSFVYLNFYDWESSYNIAVELWGMNSGRKLQYIISDEHLTMELSGYGLAGMEYYNSGYGLNVSSTRYIHTSIQYLGVYNTPDRARNNSDYPDFGNAALLVAEITKSSNGEYSCDALVVPGNTPSNTPTEQYNDTLAAGTMDSRFLDGRVVSTTILLDDYQDVPEDMTLVYVWSVEAGPRAPFRIRLSGGTWESIGAGVSNKPGQLKIKIDGIWFHEWSTQDDIDHPNAARFPLKLKMDDGTWKVVAMMTNGGPMVSAVV